MAKKKQKKTNRLLVRVLCIVLAALMVGAMLIGALVDALAEEAAPARCTANVEVLEEGALRITQRLCLCNDSGVDLDRIGLTAAPNLYASYENVLAADAENAELFADGYAPGCLEMIGAQVNGERARYAFAGSRQTMIYVYADFPAGAQVELELEYWVLLGVNRALVGANGMGMLLCDVLCAPAAVDAENQCPIASEEVFFTDFLRAQPTDYEITVALPEGWEAVGAGASETVEGQTVFRANGARGFSLALSHEWKRQEGESACGTPVRAAMHESKTAKSAVKAAVQALDALEARWGRCEKACFTIAESDFACDAAVRDGVLFVPSSLAKDADALRKTIFFAVAKQYLGFGVQADPTDDAWIADASCTYAALLLIEETDGERAFSKALNETVTVALNQTIPGGLHITTPAPLLTAREYDLLVLRRGCAVMHELRVTLGADVLWDGWGAYYALRKTEKTPTERDFLGALNAAAGSDLEPLLTDLLFNIGEYILQQPEVYE